MIHPRWAVGLLVALTPCAAYGQDATSPDQVEGLVARYEVGSRGLGRDRQADVGTWYDSSGNGFDLLLEQDGDPAIRRALRLNQQATIEPRKGAYDVREPFELQDHTIFVVVGTGSIDRALFSSDADPTRGVALYVMGREPRPARRRSHSRTRRPRDARQAFTSSRWGARPGCCAPSWTETRSLRERVRSSHCESAGSSTSTTTRRSPRTARGWRSGRWCSTTVSSRARSATRSRDTSQSASAS